MEECSGFRLEFHILVDLKLNIIKPAKTTRLSNARKIFTR